MEAWLRIPGSIELRPQGTVDATGLEARHVSGYFARTCRQADSPQPLWPKLTVVGHVGSYLIAAAIPGLGPGHDSPLVPPGLHQAARHIRFGLVLADSAYDAGHNHRTCQELGTRAVIKPNRRWFGRKWPKSPLRRRARKHLSQRTYGRRSHAESIFPAVGRSRARPARAAPC